MKTNKGEEEALYLSDKVYYNPAHFFNPLPWISNPSNDSYYKQCRLMHSDMVSFINPLDIKILTKDKNLYHKKSEDATFKRNESAYFPVRHSSTEQVDEGQMLDLGFKQKMDRLLKSLEGERSSSRSKFLQIHCSTDSENCLQFLCEIDELQPRETLQIDWVGWFPAKTADSLSNPNLKYTSRLEVYSWNREIIPNPMLIVPVPDFQQNMHTTIIFASLSSRVMFLWPIILGVVLSCLILSAIFSILYSIGFYDRENFKRYSIKDILLSPDRRSHFREFSLSFISARHPAPTPPMNRDSITNEFSL
ncbi:hypothetical protein Ciccas_004315 [Cichlidogyrus casuarinus]|uniref:Uncharacterized protein n=1 Tax=Cichlidogyrus casuarinus TaxID=1844966 RepID=A0ABD2QBY7_9PLAT